MSRLEESLDQGLVTVMDAALLKPGQLSRMQNACYFPGTKALHRSTGRTFWASAWPGALDVVGLRDTKFDNGDHYLWAHVTAQYLYGTVGDSGPVGGLTQVSSTGVTVGTQLERVHYKNRFFFFNGTAGNVSATGSNRVIYLSATATGTVPNTRPHGLLPVDAAPNITTAAGSFSQSVTGYYEYWTTEVAKIVQDGGELVLEGTFVGKPTTVFVTSTGMVPTIEMPATINGLTTHWRIYRSPKKDSEAEKKFPTGFMISEVATATASVGDTLTTSNTGFIFPSAFNQSPEFYSNATNASNLSADDGNVATLANPGIGLGSAPKSQGCYNFNFGGFSGAIKGIEVVAEGYVSSGSAPVSLYVTIGSKRSTVNGDFATWSDRQVVGVGGANVRKHVATKSGLITSTSSGTPTVLTFGGSSDRWFPANEGGMVDSQFNATFMAVLAIAGTTATVSLDYVKVKVYYSATVDSVVPFPTVVYTFGDVSAQVGKNGVLPSSSTGDIFEDCLVVNDVAAPSVVRYSYPGDPEAFPSTYYLEFETQENDNVRLIKVVNNRLCVALDSSIWRLNYLPSERDASFDRGKATEPISKTYGCVGPMCACVFSPGGGTDLLAFVSKQGICATDGYSFKFLTDALDWRGVISIASTSTPIALVNDPEEQCLIFGYRNDVAANGNETYLALRIHYDRTDEEGDFVISGPTYMRNYDSSSGGVYAALASMCVVPRSTGTSSVFLGYGGASQVAGAGSIFRETGSTIPSNDPRTGYSTRDMYLAGMGSEWELGDLYGYCGSYGGSPLLSYTVTKRKTNDTGAVTSAAKTITLGGSKLHKVQFREMGEGIKINMVATASAFQQEKLIIDGTNFDEEDSGR